MRLVRLATVTAIAALAIAPLASAALPGPIAMHPGETIQLAKGKYSGDERIDCVGNHDALDGGIWGFLGSALVPPQQPEVAAVVKHGKTLERSNHGLAIWIAVRSDFSILVSCTTHP